MQTTWPGYGIPPVNVLPVDGETCESWSIPVVLADPANVVTTVVLPSLTLAVVLWTTEALVWFSLNALPGPIPDPNLGVSVPASAFVRGQLLVPNILLTYAVADPLVVNTLYLVCRSPSPLVYVTALRQLGAGAP